MGNGYPYSLGNEYPYSLGDEYAYCVADEYPYRLHNENPFGVRIHYSYRDSMEYWSHLWVENMSWLTVQDLYLRLQLQLIKIKIITSLKRRLDRFKIGK